MSFSFLKTLPATFYKGWNDLQFSYQCAAPFPTALPHFLLFFNTLVLAKVSVVIHHYDHDLKQHGKEGEGSTISHFQLTVQLTVQHWEKSGQEFKLGRDLEAETGAEAMEEGLLTELLLTAASGSLLSWSIQGRRPRGSIVHNEQGPPTLITNQEDAPQANLVGVFSQLRFSLSTWLWLGWGWQKTSQHTIPPAGKWHWFFVCLYLRILWCVFIFEYEVWLGTISEVGIWEREIQKSS